MAASGIYGPTLAAAAIVGVVLLVRASGSSEPEAPPPVASVGPLLLPGGAGLTVGGAL